MIHGFMFLLMRMAFDPLFCTSTAQCVLPSDIKDMVAAPESAAQSQTNDDESGAPQNDDDADHADFLGFLVPHRWCAVSSS